MSQGPFSSKVKMPTQAASAWPFPAKRDNESPVTFRLIKYDYDTPVEANLVFEAAKALQDACHGDAKRVGWWKTNTGESVSDNPYAFSNKLALIHSEVSEALEGDRKSLKDDKLPHRDMREVELADAVIRIFDTAGGFGLDLAGAIAEKLAYNRKRADHKPENRKQEGGKAY